jgi:hypothetical protein
MTILRAALFATRVAAAWVWALAEAFNQHRDVFDISTHHHLRA